MVARADFPPGFIFGTGASAWQIEGQSFGGAGPTHWDAFAARPGAIADGATGAVACDHYHHFAEDLDLAAAFDAWRFSVNWARVQPEGRGAANPAGLDFYDRLVDAMLARGLRPFATLYHWELPQALAAKGGWADGDTALRFADFAELAMRRLGDRLDHVATLNEPWCSAWLGHFEGVHAPGARSLPEAARAMHNLLRGHAEALGRLRDAGHENLGIALNFEAVRPASESGADAAAAARYGALLNEWFLGAICGRGYPQEALEGLAPHLPRGWQEDMPAIAARPDWIGVNYYTRALIAADPGAPWPALRRVAGPLEKTAMGWEIFPEGMTEVLLMVHAAFGGPVVVTENGMASDEGREDPRRIAYLDAHLAAARRALEAGADLRGHFVWSLLDNLEWAFGFAKRFGLVQVDFDTLQRTPRASYRALRERFGRNA